MSAVSAAAEAAVLGACIMDPDCYPRVKHLLSPDDFEAEANRLVFAAFDKLTAASRGIETLTVTDQLERDGKLQLAGGVAGVCGLAEGLPDTANVEHYASIVKSFSIKRRLASLGRGLLADAERPERTGEELAGEAAGRLAAIASSAAARDAVWVYDVAARELARAEGVTTGDPGGLALGSEALDRCIPGGLEPGSATILAARPGVGKTALLTAIAMAASMRDLRVLLFSLEMPAEAIVRRILASLARVALTRLRMRVLDSEEWARLAWAQDQIAGWKFLIDDTVGISAEQVLARARRHALTGGVDLVLVDYLGKVAARGENRTAAVGTIARGLKDAARSLGVPLIAAAQLSRLNVREDRRPTLSDLRDSGEIEQEADNVLLMHPIASDFGARVIEVAVAKQRNGPLGVAKLIFHEDQVRFAEYGAGGPPRVEARP